MLKFLSRGTTLVLFALILSCTGSNKDYNIKYFSKRDFPVFQDLVGEKLVQDHFMYPKHLLLLKDYLIVGEKFADTLLHVICKDNLMQIGLVGINGLGPGEIGYPFRLYRDPLEANSFWAYDVAGRKMLSRFSADKCSMFYPDTQVALTDSLFFLMDFTFSSDTTFLGLGANGSIKFHEFSIKNKKAINHWGSWDELGESDWPGNVTMSLYSGEISTNATRDIFVLSSGKMDHLDVLNRLTGEQFGLRGPEDFTPEVAVDWSLSYPMLAWNGWDNKYGYVKSVVGDQYIYALYSGWSSMQVDHNHEKGWDKILVFKLDGSPHAFYQLDHQLIDFEVDWAEGIVYGITAIDEDPGLVIFRF